MCCTCDGAVELFDIDRMTIDDAGDVLIRGEERSLFTADSRQTIFEKVRNDHNFKKHCQENGSDSFDVINDVRVVVRS